MEVAALLASMFRLPKRPVRLLDPGAGVGSLTAAVVERAHRLGAGPLDVTAVEVDRRLARPLADTLADCEGEARTTSRIVRRDFTEWATSPDVLGGEPFDLVVMNPPYRKVGVDSAERARLEGIGVTVTNLYAAFLTLGARLLRPGGQLVAITPRSFTNGPYFQSFREDFLASMALRRVHVFERRDAAFGDSEVLQENVAFHAVKGGQRASVHLTAGSTDGHYTSRRVPYSEVVRPDDAQKFITLAADEVGAIVTDRLRTLEGTLSSIGCAVSTGRVVDFRTRSNLRDSPGRHTVPLIYPTHFSEGSVRWPIEGSRKPNALVLNDTTRRLMLPAGHYVLVKRFTSKEERRRLVAVVSDPDDVPGPLVAFENHVNVFHDRSGGLAPLFARGLACYLNSTAADLYFRQFNGHTQVNATDLRAMPYPTRDQLERFGAAVGDAVLSQEKTDFLVAECVPELAGL